MVSRKPSDELSEPRRPRGKPGDPGEPGDREYGDAECCRVGWNCAVAWTAEVVGPEPGAPALVVIVRGLEEAFCDVDVEFEVEEECVYVVCGEAVVVVVEDEGAFGRAECALKAARKLDMKGRLVDMVTVGAAGAAEGGS